ncbi:AAA family ATPase [Spirosoma aerolatum]|uniref:AAA family ATPase n=1 Tax=Spirosoma aerolatum TaxID=1211326 RepID=UPI0009AE9FD7|nr:ATP-binding protein [Spirosoma aerolatum]
MLVKFSVRNYKVFRDRAELSLVASSYDKETNRENIIEVPKFGLSLLKSAVVYGANASGKSKLIEALGYMRNFIHVSSKDSQKGDAIPVEPFRLSTVFENEPSEFEVTFIHKEVLYRYGFEATQREIISEWLYYRPNTKEIELFYRDHQIIELHKRSFSGIVSQLVKGNNIRENALLLSVAAQFNDERAGGVFDWFNKLRITSGLDDEDYARYTLEQTQQADYKQIVLKLLQVADLGIQDFEVRTFERSKLPFSYLSHSQEDLKHEYQALEDEARTIHKKYNEENQEVGSVVFSLNDDESSGTQKFFAIVAPIIDALFDGSVFVVDELDAKLHPNLVCFLVDLFHSSSTNYNNAQLIFNTHDTNLLSSGNFRRDQIWFTEKDRYGAASLYSLADYKPRKGENFERNYIEGRYGAIPFLGDFSRLFTQESVYARTEE